MVAGHLRDHERLVVGPDRTVAHLEGAGRVARGEVGHQVVPLLGLRLAAVLATQGDRVDGDGAAVDLAVLGLALGEPEPPVHLAYGVVALQHLTGEHVEPGAVLVVEGVADRLLHHLHPGHHRGPLGGRRLGVEVEAPRAGALRTVEVEIEEVDDAERASVVLEDEDLATRVRLHPRPPVAVLVDADLVVVDAHLAVHGVVAPHAHALQVGVVCRAQHVVPPRVGTASGLSLAQR